MSDEGQKGSPTNVSDHSPHDVSSLDDWERLPADPELADDFGYETIELEVVETSNGSEDVLLLPSDEDMLKDDAFIVSKADTLCDLGEWL